MILFSEIFDKTIFISALSLFITIPPPYPSSTSFFFILVLSITTSFELVIYKAPAACLLLFSNISVSFISPILVSFIMMAPAIVLAKFYFTNELSNVKLFEF